MLFLKTENFHESDSLETIKEKLSNITDNDFNGANGGDFTGRAFVLGEEVAVSLLTQCVLETEKSYKSELTGTSLIKVIAREAINECYAAYDNYKVMIKDYNDASFSIAVAFID